MAEDIDHRPICHECGRFFPTDREEEAEAARRRAEGGLNNGQDQLIKALSDRAKLIAAVEKHERAIRPIFKDAVDAENLWIRDRANADLWSRVRSISQGDSG